MNNKNYINKSWQDAKDGSTLKVENPFTEEIIAEVPNSSASDVSHAVSVAKAAWKEWKMLGSLEMRDLLREFAVKSRAHDREIASIITAESGKPLIECLLQFPSLREYDLTFYKLLPCYFAKKEIQLISPPLIVCSHLEEILFLFVLLLFF